MFVALYTITFFSVSKVLAFEDTTTHSSPSFAEDLRVEFEALVAIHDKLNDLDGMNLSVGIHS